VFHRLRSPRFGLMAVTFLAACQAGGVRAGETVLTSPASLPAVSLAQGERLRLVASTSIVAGVVAQVGGEQVDVATLIPPGVDPHAYEPTPQDLASVAEAHLILLNGFGLETSLEGLLSSSGEAVPVVSLSEGIPPRHLDSGGGAGAPADERGSVDPHTWMDPNNVLVWVDNVAAALASLDPLHASVYRTRAAEYAAELRALDADIRDAVAAIPPEGRLLVTDHEELGYFADRYGFQVVGQIVPSTSSAAEPSAQALAGLEEAIGNLGARAIFVSAAANPALARRIADDTGVRLVSLHLHSLTGPEGPAPDYTTLMRYNVDQIVAALAP
jgi:ABC-type Zn uptake system ZnuABC Zn-binding protein ZnuA